MTERHDVHPRFAELEQLLERTRQLVTDAAAAVPPELRDHAPDDGRWSAADVLGHLARVERGVVKLLDREFAAARARGALLPDLDTSSILAHLDPGVLADRRRRIEAPEPVRPRPELGADGALAELATSRSGLLALLAREHGRNLAQVTWPHPILGVLDGYQWVLFVGRHEARHAEQIRELATTIA